MALPIVRWSKGAADGMIDEHCAWRSDLAHDVVRRADHHSRNPMALDHVSDETDGHGLVAEGSIRYEQRRIDFTLF